MSIKISSIASISGWPFKSTEDALTDDEWAAMSEAYFNRLEEKDVALDEAADRINLLNLFVREGQQIHRLISRKCCQRWQENTVAAMVPDAATCQGMIHRFCEEPLFTFANPCSYQKSTYQFFFEHFILLSIGANCVCLALYDPLDEMEDSDKAITLYWIEFVLLMVTPRCFIQSRHSAPLPHPAFYFLLTGFHDRGQHQSDRLRGPPGPEFLFRNDRPQDLVDKPAQLGQYNGLWHRGRRVSRHAPRRW
jgi:hypothetical protein